MKHDLRIAAAFRRESSDRRLWLARAIVITAAGAAGLTVVQIKWQAERALEGYLAKRTRSWRSPRVWMLRASVPSCG